ncbi:MAG: ATP-binding protein [Methanomassiliicoccaceae archaeon]|jgi:ABC-type lipoprotein export system ATPase subunit|nr:ATP-binding protein [Methanomassiliicoccaceae archaeon]
MKIKTISVYGLFGRHDHTVNVFNDGLTYIHSPNGCGKSTLIRVMSLLFAGSTKDLMTVPFERMDISFSDDSSLIVERSENELLIQMQRNEIVSPLDANELPALARTTFIPSERTVVRRGDGRIMNAVEAYANDLSGKLKTAKKQHELVVPQYNDDRGDDELVFWAKDLNAKLNFIRDAGIVMNMPAGLRFPPTRYDLMESRKQYSDLIHGISEFVGKNYYLSESTVVFKDVINSFLLDKELRVDEKSHVVFVLDNGVVLPMDSLSSGEKQLFILFYRMLFEAMPSSFVMIDEPEISLHVSWQQRLGQAMKDIARLRDLQVVVATHSPQIVHNDWDLANELRAGRA